MDACHAEAMQTKVRVRILRAFVRRRLIDKDERTEMESRDHGGGFSLDATVHITANDRHGLERLLPYCARPAFAAERLRELDAHRLIYHLPKPGPDGRTQLILSPLELIERIAALVPPPRVHRHRYYRVLASNASLRAAVTAMAPAAIAVQTPPVQTSGEAPLDPPYRSPARDLWAMLLARIYEAFPPNLHALRGRDAHHRLHDRGSPGAANSEPHRRARDATADRPGARTSVMGGRRLRNHRSR